MPCRAASAERFRRPLIVVVAALAGALALALPAAASPGRTAARQCGTIDVYPQRSTSDIVTGIRAKGVTCPEARRLIRQAAKVWPSGAETWTSGGFRWRARLVETTAAIRGVSGPRWIRGTYVVF